MIKLSSPATGGYWEIPVLFEDEHLLALDKPSELPTSPDRSDPQRPSLIKLLHAGIAERKAWTQDRQGLSYLMNVHRLDLETSGVLLLAKNKSVFLTLADMFGSEKPLKKYVTLARGHPAAEEFEVDAKLAPHPLKPALIHVDHKRGKRAHTRFRVLERFDNYVLLQCEPVTSRTHQVQVHLRHIGLPVVGDALYGGRPLSLSQLKPNYHPKENEPERPLLGRVALHAQELQLPHPVSGETLTITSPLPKDFAVALKYLRRFGKRMA